MDTCMWLRHTHMVNCVWYFVWFPMGAVLLWRPQMRDECVCFCVKCVCYNINARATITHKNTHMQLPNPPDTNMLSNGIPHPRSASH